MPTTKKELEYASKTVNNFLEDCNLEVKLGGSYGQTTADLYEKDTYNMKETLFRGTKTEVYDQLRAMSKGLSLQKKCKK